MSDSEGKILKIYDKSKPEDEDLHDVSYYMHWLWGVVVLLVGVVFWLCIALVNAENQRNALATKQCADPVFKGEIDRAVPAHRALARALVGTPVVRRQPREAGSLPERAAADLQCFPKIPPPMRDFFRP
jgi:hypothetical protein